MQPDTSTRLRLLEIRTPGGALRLGGGFSCVLAAPAARSAAARWIATSVAGPRPSDAEGTIEIAGRFVSVRSLPSPLLPPSSPSVLGREVLRAQWRAAWAARRDELAAAHASRRLAQHRAEAALDRARHRADELSARVDEPPPEYDEHERARRDVEAQNARTDAAPSAEYETAMFQYEDDQLRRERIAVLVAALGDLSPVPSPRALAIADEWDAMQQRRDDLLMAAGEQMQVDADISAAEARVNAARIALALASGGIEPEARHHIDTLHREVIDAEADISETKRRDRPVALARYEEAVRAEQEALAATGIESYAAFLVAIAQGAQLPDPAARAEAEQHLKAAEVDLEHARHEFRAHHLDEAQVHAELNLRARAAEVLGRFPDDDVAADLRAVRVDHPDAAPVRQQLHAELIDMGVAGIQDPLATARELLALPVDPPARPPGPTAPVVAPDPPPSVERRRVLTDDHAPLHTEVMALVQTRDEHAAALDALDAELARLDALRDAELDALSADDTGLVVTTLLETYRSGDVLAGRLPLVLDGALDGLPTANRTAAIATLAGAADVQAIIVTDDPLVVDAVRMASGTVQTWPEAATTPVVAAPAPGRRVNDEVARLAPAAVAASVTGPGATPERCSTHADATSIARCAHCGKPSCLDCLVYVIGEPELWCTTCAVARHGARPRNLRVLRRRGA